MAIARWVWCVGGGLAGLIARSLWYTTQKKNGGDLKLPSSFIFAVFFGVGMAFALSYLVDTIPSLEVGQWWVVAPLVMELVVMLFKTDFLHVLMSSEEVESEAKQSEHRLLRASFFDRLKYTLFVTNIVVQAYVVGKCPDKMPILYTVKILVLFPVRFYEFRQRGMHLYNYELCLFVNYAILAFLWLPDSFFDQLVSYGIALTRKNLFLALFGLANGPVAWYIIMFDGTLSFYDRGKTTSAFVHFGPPLITYCLRHFATVGESAESFVPADGELIVGYSLTFYLLWASFQYFVVLGLYITTVQEKNLLCVWMEHTFDPIRKFTRSHAVNRLVYFAIHGGMATIVITLTPIFYQYEAVHFYFLVGVGLFAVWNGASDSLQRFQEAYEKELRDRLKIRDPQAEAANPELVEKVKKMIVAARGEESLTVDGVGDKSLHELGMDSLKIGLLGSRIQDDFAVYDLELAEIQNKTATQIAVLVAARAGKGATSIDPAPPSFSHDPSRPSHALGEGATLAEIFLSTCDRMKSHAAIADDSKRGGNVMTYSKLKMGSLLIAEYLHHQEGMAADKRVGVMLPAAAGSAVVVFGALVAGKVPVMFNFTIGANKLEYSVKDSGVRRILTSRKFISTLVAKGVDLPPSIGDMFLFVEDIMSAYTTLDLIIASVTLGFRGPKALLSR
jgi:hypothetical protein